MRKYILGLDLGQAADYTAFSLIEDMTITRHMPDLHDVAVGSPGPKRVERWWALRYLYRPPLSTSYPAIVEHLERMVSTPDMSGNVEVVADATGVGRPVIDMIRAKTIYPVAVTISAGNTVHADRFDYTVPKIDIVGSLQAAFASRTLKIAPELTLAPALMKELERFSVKITKAGNASYEALKESDHDDLVISLGLAMWWAGFTRAAYAVHDPLDKPEEPYDPREYLRTT